MIHKFKWGNTNFVMDANSGAVHVVDDVSYDILDYINGVFLDYTEDYVVKKLENKYPKDEIRESYKELLELYKNEKLFSKDTYENLATPEKLSSPIKSVCLNVAHDCNLRCKYCFASEGKFGCGKRELMPPETAKKAIDFLIQKSGNIRNLELDFFGGEPLLNWNVVTETVKYARSLEKKYNKNFRFTLTTNGMLLNDEKIDFINKEIYDVVLSLDGRKETNDRFRIGKNKQGSYDLIVPKFQKLVSKRGSKQYYVRGTYTKKNLDFSSDLMHLYSLGFKSLSLEPVICAENFEYCITDDEMPKVLEEYELACSKLIELKKSGKYISFFNFNINLSKGPCVVKRLKGCGCGNDYVAITPNGDIFACHQFVGEEKFKMGNVNSGAFDENLKLKFVGSHIYNKEECRDCWAKFYCTGGCASKNYFKNNDIMIPFDINCRLQKKKIECAVALRYFTK